MTTRPVALGVLLVSVVGMLISPGIASADDRGPAAQQFAPGPPPPPRYEVILAGPGSSYVWAPGHWQYARGWVWIPGQWVAPPYPGAVWIPGHWVQRHRGWVWIEGSWRGEPPDLVVVASPPPPRVEVVGVAPFVGTVWIGGFWRWTGTRWIWVPGHSARAPYPGAVWVPGHWARRQAGDWVWIEGSWR